MSQAQSVWKEPWDVDRRLAELGQTRTALRTAVERAQAAWAACTPNYPRNFPGIASWANAICALRDLGAPDGWLGVDDLGQPLCVKGDVALTAASGDENTGRTTGPQPQTKSSKGPVMAKAIDRNAYLFPQMQQDADEEIARQVARAKNTWVLLMYRDEVVGEVRCELSRPIRMDQDRHIDEWSERIILDPVEFEVTESGNAEGGGEDGGEISIEIRRRG
jgi:hypothetical protein